jgi:hypothetical protein
MRTQEVLAIVSAFVWLSGAAPAFAQGNTRDLLAQADPPQIDPRQPPSNTNRGGRDQDGVDQNPSNNGNVPDSSRTKFQGILMNPNGAPRIR